MNNSADRIALEKIQNLISKSSNPIEDQGIIDVVCDYLKVHKQDHTIFDIHRWISIMRNNESLVFSSNRQYRLVKKHGLIRNISLRFTIKQHGFLPSISNEYLVELLVNSDELNKNLYALGFKNDDEGYFITNLILSGWVGDPSLSFIRGKNKKTDSLFVLHTFWDYLSLLSHLKVDGLETDTIILHSFECIAQLKGYIYQSAYKNVYSWLPNNPDGRRAIRHISSLVRQETSLIHITMNALYQPFDNVNDWYKAQANH